MTMHVNQGFLTQAATRSDPLQLDASYRMLRIVQRVGYMGEATPELIVRSANEGLDRVWLWADDLHETLDGMQEGLYWASGILEGIYVHHRLFILWLDWLCHVVHQVDLGDVLCNPTAWRGTAFFELFMSADRYRCIGPVTSSRLGRDFRKYAGKVRNVKPAGVDGELYCWFRWAATLAGRGGILMLL